MDQEKIGKFITNCRKGKNLTQEQLAEKLGITSKSVSRWENGKTMPDYSLLKDICAELDINVNELLSGEKIESNDYRVKAEENFINLKKKVDRVLKLLNICGWIVAIALIVLFILRMYFNWLDSESWDNLGFKNITNTLIYISTACMILCGMLNYEAKK